jgi:hypothetical protein
VNIVGGTSVVTPGYFETMQMPLVAGEFSSRQAALSGAMPEVMVNRSFADRYIPGSSAVGLHLADQFTLPNSPSNRVAGIVADARERGIDRSPEPDGLLLHLSSAALPRVPRQNGERSRTHCSSRKAEDQRIGAAPIRLRHGSARGVGR